MIKQITTDKLKELIKTKKINIIDVRNRTELEHGYIPNSTNIPMGNLLSAKDISTQLSPDKTYYIICQSGGRSLTVTKAITDCGYKAINVQGGMNAFRNSQ